MYLIHTSDKAQLEPLRDSLDAIDDLDHLDLGEINSLAMIELAEEALSWFKGPPVINDEEGGLCVGPFSDDGIQWLRGNSDALAEYGADPKQVVAFADRCGAGEVYFLDTY